SSDDRGDERSLLVLSERVDGREELIGGAGADRRAIAGGDEHAAVAGDAAFEAVFYHRHVLALAQGGGEVCAAVRQPVERLLAEVHDHQSTARSSTSKVSSAFGGITPGTPRAP